METSNPLLKRADVFAQETTDNMTFDGALFKTAILLVICVVSACFAWVAPAALQLPLMIVGMLGGLAMVLVTMFKSSLSPICAPAYAALEGLALGVISSMFETAYHGIVLNAVVLTFGVLALMLLLFTSRAIRVTPGFRVGVIAMTGAIVLVYIVDMVMRLFGVHVPFINDSGPVGIAISLVISAVAAFNLLLDFDAIEQGVRARAPKYLEWYCGLSLLVTLVWLYLELLRLLSKLQRR
ncbi:MAG TPA: Bax inhibitor-1/YccA family protein [Verrucomicrobiae bacterium]|jgi:uncharacterized YccA/Bax inhibitor family protein|nr:Bax inhibitor-1/YccA family protein [Verrucomicrobiae bacterium]